MCQITIITCCTQLYHIPLVARFSMIIEDLLRNISLNREVLKGLIRKNETLGYQKVNELARFIGLRYAVNLQLHFPEATKISEVELYGQENIGIVVDKFRKRFPLARDIVKQK